MNKKNQISKLLENKLSMYLVLISLCLKSLSILTLIPAVLAAFQKFQTRVTELQSLIKQKILITTGLSKDKRMFKILLAEHAEFIANAVYSYADSISNYNLRNSVKYTKSELVKMRDSLLIETCNNIYTLGINNLGNLGDYNVDGNTMQTLLTTIGLYNDQSPLPTSAIEHRRVLTDEIKKKQIEIGDFKKNQFDKATKLLRPTNASFVDEFFASSRVIDAGTRHKKDVVPADPNRFAYLTGNVSDSNGDPIEDAKVEVIGQKKTYVVETDEDGDYLVDGIEDDVCTVHISIEGKQHIDVFDVVFKQDDEIEWDFTMEDEEPEPTPTPEA